MDSLASPFTLVGWSLFGLALLSLASDVPRRMRVGTWALLALYGLLSMPLIANLALQGLEQRARELQARCSSPPAGSLFVVLAGGIHVDSGDSGAVGTLGGESMRRLLAAVRLAQGVPASELLLSGGNGGRWREADLMRVLALRLGFPANRILLDRESKTTFESARNVAQMLRGRVPPHLYLVTSAYHLPRALSSFERVGVPVCASPVDFQALRVTSWDMVIPSRGAMRKMGFALHEYLGDLYYEWALPWLHPIKG